MRLPFQIQHAESANSVFSGDNSALSSSDYGSPGITHSAKIKYDISSIDKIHDDARNKLLVITGKQHLGVYKILGDEEARDDVEEEEQVFKPSFIHKPAPRSLNKIILMKDLLYSQGSGSGSLGNLSSESYSNLNNHFSVSIPESVINNSLNTSHNSVSPAGSFKFLNKGFNASHVSQSPGSGPLQQQLPHLTLQSRHNSTSSMKIKPLATNSDVKSGYKEFNHLIAVTNTSTTVSLYDINRLNASTLFATIQEHSRTINSVDFHSHHASYFLAGDMNGVAKIYDLRKIPSASSPAPSTASQTSYRTLSDLTIMTQQNDAIRDIKWNPLSPHVFATIHDSGTILKYDIRYTAVPEKKISAHDGPGLCIHWAPPVDSGYSYPNSSFHQSSAYGSSSSISSDYLASGGRDGKLCYWYMGDSRPSLGIPERTVVVGDPVNKLKFRPHLGNLYSKSNAFAEPESRNLANNVWSGKQDSSALSSFELDDMQVAISTNNSQMNNNITIYSPSRIYMPRQIIATRASSNGFVWFDENHIFNIDKRNCINGFDIRKEPLMEENLGGKGLRWRDIEGDGLVFGMPIGVPSRYMHTVEGLEAEGQNLAEIEDFNQDTIPETTEKKTGGQKIEKQEKKSSNLSFLDKSATNSPVSSFLKQKSTLLRSSNVSNGSPVDPANLLGGISNSQNNFLLNMRRQKKMQTQQGSLTKSFSHSNSPVDRGNTPTSSPFQQLVHSHSNWTSVTSYNSHQSHDASIATSASVATTSAIGTGHNQSLLYPLNTPLILKKLALLSPQQSLTDNEHSETLLRIDNNFENFDTSPLEMFKHLAKNLSYANITFLPMTPKSDSISTLSKEIEREKQEKIEREKIISDLGFHDDWLATTETHTGSELKSSERKEVVSNPKMIPENQSQNENSLSLSNTDVDFKVTVADYMRLQSVCQHNADVYSKINDFSKSKIWNLIEKSISFHISEIEKNHGFGDIELKSDGIYREVFDDEAILDDDDDEYGIDDDGNIFVNNSDLDSQSSFSKSSSFVSNLKHRASSSHNYGKQFREKIVPVKYMAYDDDNALNQSGKIKKKRASERPDQAELRSDILKNNKPWSLNRLLPYLFKQSQKTGDILTASLLLLNFQQIVPLSSKSNVKSAIYDLICILHTYELFEVSAQLLKSCYFAKDILSISNNSVSDQEESISSNAEEVAPSDGVSLSTITIDRLKPQDNICIFCESKVTSNATMLLKCGHIGHTSCLSSWFHSMGCLCPAGCIGKLL